MVAFIFIAPRAFISPFLNQMITCCVHACVRPCECVFVCVRVPACDYTRVQSPKDFNKSWKYLFPIDTKHIVVGTDEVVATHGCIRVTLIRTGMRTRTRT